MATSQQRCVFVGNIPYDATEEQLLEICREVGPVVSFRLVIDRETGKPKGYGFCEYKDEETALSARRNLQAYDINGRQLRVDFAENDKGTDRSQQSRAGGPGLAANPGGPASLGEAVNHQPIGLHIAITAATTMAGALGSPQVASHPTNQLGLQGQSESVNDPLTLHLAKMSRSQLNEILSELKGMATQNKDQARHLLLARPQLLKALFQAQIMLGMVTPQVLQMPNIRLASTQPMPHLLPDGQQVLQPVVQDHRLPPLAQKAQTGFQNSLGHNQFPAPSQPTMLSQISAPLQRASNLVPQVASLHGPDGSSTIPSMHPSVRTQTQLASSSSLYPKMQQYPLPQYSGKVGAANFGDKAQIVLPPRPTADAHFQPSPSTSLGIPDAFNRGADGSARDDATWIHKNNAYSKSTNHDSLKANNRPLKILKVDGGRSIPSSVGQFNAPNAPGSSSQAFGVRSIAAKPIPKAEEMQYPEKQIVQPLLTRDVESALLLQVMNLTPEQVNSLPPDQREQVIQLQRALQQKTS